MSAWHIITGEYPPDIGGVSDYCRVVAEGLAAAGDEVHVLCPSRSEGAQNESLDSIHVHPVLGRFAPGDLRNADRLLDSFPSPRRLLVQWVPQGFGYRSMNLAFCAWILKRGRRGDQIEVMVHEPFLALWEGSPRQTAAALVHRVMTIILVRASTRIWVSIPAWERKWRPYALEKVIPFEWLPIPNTLPRPNCDAVRSARTQDAQPRGHLVGHFSTYGSAISQTLTESLATLLAISPYTSVVLFGHGSLRFRARFAEENSLLALRVKATGYLPPAELAEQLAACELLLQPYPDGISTRRTSAMAGLALGVPIATMHGHVTERLWSESTCVALADSARGLAVMASDLLENQLERDRLKAAGLAVYSERFDIARTITALRRAG